MKKFFPGRAALLICALLLLQSFTHAAHARALRVFLIGNSFSQDAARYLPQLAREGGHELKIGRAELGGHSLKQHWSYVEAAEANPDDPKGKAYGGKSLRDLLSAGTWDVVTIQQASVYSPDAETYRPYAQRLRDFIKTLQPGAEVVFHQTWAYRKDARGFGFVDAEAKRRAKDQREMWERLHVAYRTVAKELNLRVIPVGDAFWRAGADEKWGYKKDETFDYKNPVAPTLPNQAGSLHVGYNWSKSSGKFQFDPNHASAAGSYLGGLVWYGFLFGESPEKLTFAPNIPADFAAFLRQTAAQTLQTEGKMPPATAAPATAAPATAAPATGG